jgi:hypothetical protein
MSFTPTRKLVTGKTHSSVPGTALSQHLPGGTEENHESPQSGLWAKI